MESNRIRIFAIQALAFISLCACQHTLNGIGVDMEHAGKQISAYSKKG